MISLHVARRVVTEATPPPPSIRRIRILLWALVAIAVATAVALVAVRERAPQVRGQAEGSQINFGGPFTLQGADGKPFSSQALAGKPYAIYFGFTRCGDVCPTTLSRLVKLRAEAANEQAIRILFVTIDPEHDGPKEVGQYAELFGSPIIGLTGNNTQIDEVKRQFGIFAEPVPHAAMGRQMEHTATVLLFDRNGKFAATISPDEPDNAVLAKMKALVA
jgi:protein SCO1/2